MNKNGCILVIFGTCIWTLVCSENILPTSTPTLSRKPRIPGSYSSGNCLIVDVTNGYTRYSGAGRIVRFFCHKPYVLVGSTSAICSHGEWNHPPPFCASTSCPSLGRISHGNIAISNKGAIATPTCDSGFTLIGSPSLLCIENEWNGTSPVCQADSLLQFGTCHFEPTESQQCSWILKPALFKWTLVSSDKHNSSDIENYPRFDHTLGPHPGGHYLYLKNAMPVSSISLRLEQRPDNGAKYISPLFPAVEGTEEWCLIFFIYSFGSNAGNVKVTINNDTVWENNELLRRNLWTKVTITLVHQRAPFRITIIGKGTLGQSSNTAIDDLRIAHGPDCLDKSDKVLPYFVEPGFEEEYEDSESHEIYKRETTTEASTSDSSTAEMITKISTLSSTEDTSVHSSESVTKVDSSEGSEKSPQTSETSSTGLNSSAQSTFTSLSAASDFSHSSTVTSAEDVILFTSEETLKSMVEEDEEMLALIPSGDYQSTESSQKIGFATGDSISTVRFQPTDDPGPNTGMAVKSENFSGWSDLEKSMVYFSLVVVSTIVLIVTIVVIRYRNYRTIAMSNKKVSYNSENVAFLNGVELVDKY